MDEARVISLTPADGWYAIYPRSYARIACWASIETESLISRIIVVGMIAEGECLSPADENSDLEGYTYLPSETETWLWCNKKGEIIRDES